MAFSMSPPDSTSAARQSAKPAPVVREVLSRGVLEFAWLAVVYSSFFCFPITLSFLFNLVLKTPASQSGRDKAASSAARQKGPATCNHRERRAC